MTIWKRAPRAAALLGALALSMALAAPAAAQSVLAAHDDTAATTQGATVKVHVLANDTAPDGVSHDDLEVVAVGAPANGTAVIYAERYVKYTPDAGFLGTDSFTYAISDGTGTVSATVAVTVKAKVEKPEKEKPAKEQKEEEKKETTWTASTEVTAACVAHGSTPGLTALCGLYSGGQLPPWAADSIGKVILKLAPKPDPVATACAATGLDETLQALCDLYQGNRLPPGINKQIGKFILELSSGGTVSAVKLKP